MVPRRLERLSDPAPGPKGQHGRPPRARASTGPARGQHGPGTGAAWARHGGSTGLAPGGQWRGLGELEGQVEAVQGMRAGAVTVLGQELDELHEHFP